MKQLNFLVLLILISITNLCSQTDDQQWYVVNSFGFINEEGRYNPTDEIGNVLTISGIPGIEYEAENNACINAYAKRNDVFVIYDNPSSFYNSRFENRCELNDLNYYQGDIINLQAPDNRGISYLYWTNPYDDDDEPESAISGPIDSDNPWFELGLSETDTLQANHALVSSTDITVIIPTLEENGEYRLYYNIVVEDDMEEYHQPLFHPVEDGNELENSSYITIKGRSNYQFRVFKSLPYTETLLGKKGRFKLVDQEGKVIDILDEEIRVSHDPNVLVLNSICRETNGAKYANYTLYFENTGTTFADSITIDMRLPDFASGRTMCRKESNFGKGLNYDKHMTYIKPLISQQAASIKIVGNKNDVNLPARRTDQNASTGYVKFCLKIDTSFHGPYGFHPLVTFDNNAPIRVGYYEPRYKKNLLVPFINLINCNCNCKLKTFEEQIQELDRPSFDVPTIPR